MVGHVYAAASFSVLAAVSPGLERPVLTIVEVRCKIMSDTLPAGSV